MNHLPIKTSTLQHLLCFYLSK